MYFIYKWILGKEIFPELFLPHPTLPVSAEHFIISQRALECSGDMNSLGNSRLKYYSLILTYVLSNFWNNCLNPKISDQNASKQSRSEITQLLMLIQQKQFSSLGLSYQKSEVKAWMQYGQLVTEKNSEPESDS